GIWEEVEDEKDETHHIFRIVTVTANNLLNDLDDSMPLILEKDQYKKWLQMDSKTEDLVAMFKTYPEDKMFKYAVSSKLENTNYNDPDLIEKVTPMDQHGNYSLFG
ncbi:MAG: SOS response-associated peptidase, partial [Cyclobacteriaceae bacterium]|nr:SOS response-associated peptidase [Cyclobacteriaceae bacterium]